MSKPFPRAVLLVAASLAAAGLACGASVPAPVTATTQVGAKSPGVARASDGREPHLTELRQLTFGGENAEAYWSSTGDELIFQSTRPPYACDQIFRTSIGEGTAKLVSTGTGRTTCAYFYPGDRRVLYASTHASGPECPPTPDRSQGYVWPLYDTYEIYSAKPDGTDVRPLTQSKGYDAEATICSKDGSIVFTSTRDGDIDLYRMDADGSNVTRLTNTPGYDGGAFFSQDCTQLVWRASRPTGRDLDEYRALLAKGLVRPSKLELFVGDADGKNAHQVTSLGVASFAPFFFPDGKRLIFSSNAGDPKGREFNLWAVNVDGTGLEQLTFAEGFDGFPMFSPDGTQLAFASNRHNDKEGDTNLFVARWVDKPAAPAVASPLGAPQERVIADVRWLADDARAGRGTGTPEAKETVAWLEARMKALGLEPGTGGGYLQEFQVRAGARRGAQTALVLDGKALPADAFVPHGASRSGTVKGALVFAGYGISAPDLGHDDYKGLNVKGKLVVARRFSPQTGRFDDPDVQRRWGDVATKARAAREHGALGLILVDAPTASTPAAPKAAAGPPVPAAAPMKGASGPSPGGAVRGSPAGDVPTEAPLPVLQAEPFGDAGIPIVVLRRAEGVPLTVKGKHAATITVALEHDTVPAWNVIGKLRAGAKTTHAGTLVVGAHHDHLGLGGRSSLAPGVSAPHNGADDNASGVAALFETARLLREQQPTLQRDVLFVAFGAEELGAIGSTHFTREPPAGLMVKDLVGMLNMDMVGRLHRGELAALGAESGEEWPLYVGVACATQGLTCALSGSGYGPSDHTAFYASGVPVLHFFTGPHADYHKPTDDVDRINATGIVQVARAIADLTLRITARADRIAYKKSAAPVPMGDVRATGASLGTVPDYVGPPDGSPGVLLAGVREGGPAANAGLTRGDQIVRIGTTDVRNVEDLMFVLRTSKPGQVSKLRYKRDGKPLEVDVTFGQPGRR